MPLLILLELDDDAPVKTMTALHTMDGVIDVHMNFDLSPAELRRLLKDTHARQRAAQSGVLKKHSKPIRELILELLLRHVARSYGEVGEVIIANGGAAGSAGATLNKMKRDGEVKNGPDGWSLTAKGYRVAGGETPIVVKAGAKAKPKVKAKANGKERGGFGNEEVLTMLRRAGGKKTLDAIAEAFEQHGKTRDHARGTIERLKSKKLVETEVTAEGERIVHLKEERANASA